MREFAGEYGRGVRQENVRSKAKELTGTLPYALVVLKTRKYPRMWNPESTDMESGVHSVESGIQDSLGLPYMGRTLYFSSS